MGMTILERDHTRLVEVLDTVLAESNANVLERASKKSTHARGKPWTIERRDAVGSQARIVFGESAVLHLATGVYEEGCPLIDFAYHAHAKDAEALLFVPRVKVTMAKSDALLVFIREPIVGTLAPNRKLALMLRARVPKPPDNE